LVATWLLCRWTSGHWECWDKPELVASLVDLVAVTYPVVALSVEAGGRVMFWAFEQWKKDRAERLRREKEFRDQMRAEGRAELREGLARWLAEGGTAEDWLEHIALEDSTPSTTC
jgi:hypothetical protein